MMENSQNLNGSTASFLSSTQNFKPLYSAQQSNNRGIQETSSQHQYGVSGSHYQLVCERDTNVITSGLEFNEKKIEHPFFESASKYISLKNFKANYSGGLSLSKEAGQAKSIFEQEVTEKGLSIKNWFDKLSLPDKGLVLTTIDKQLVGLIRIMYRYYAKYGNGKFSNLHYPPKINQYKQVDNLNLHFQKPQRMAKFQTTSTSIKEKQEAEDIIIRAIRIFSSNDDEKNLDSFTLNIDIYKNFNYFVSIIKKAQQNTFLLREFQINEDPTRLKNSPFNIQDDKSLPKYYVTLIPANPDLNLTEFTLGQCLIYLFEKAINVHFIEYLKTFSKTQMNNLFVEPKWQKFQFDRQLTMFWHKQLTPDQRNQIFNQINDINDKIIQEDHMKQQKDSIKEVECSDEDNYNSEDEYNDLEMGCPKGDQDISEFQHIYNDADDIDDYYIEGEYNYKQKPANSSSQFTSYGIYGMGNNVHYKQKHKNHLLENINNKLNFSKTKLLRAGRDNQDEEKSFEFINEISFCLNLECLKRKMEKAYNEPTQILMERFYLLLQKEKQKMEDSQLEDLIKQEEQKTKKQPKKCASHNQNVPNQQTANSTINTNNQVQSNQQYSVKKNKKKNKKKKEGSNQQKDEHKVNEEKETANKEELKESPQQQDTPQIKQQTIPLNLDKDIQINNNQMNQQEITAVIRKMDIIQIDENIKSKIEKELTYKQRIKDERTSLLTGEFIENKYPDDLDELLTHQQTQSVKNKKKKKQKKNKNKNKDVITQSDKEQPQHQYSNVESNQNSIFQGLELNQNNANSDIKEETLLKILSSIQSASGVKDNQLRQVFLSDKTEDIEKIEMEQISLEIEMPMNLQNDKKINNFIENQVQNTPLNTNNDGKICSVDCYQDHATVKDDQLEVKMSEKQEEDEENATRKMVENLTQSICKQAILSQEDKQRKESSAFAKKEDSKSKKKKTKKQKRKNNSQNEKTAHEQMLANQKLEEQECDDNKQTAGGNEKLQKIKKVGFRLARDARGENEEDLLAIPKRGSSRGSSGNEEVGHLNTMNMLGELFPSEYKNPSEDVKTTMSIKSNSNSPEQQTNSYQDDSHQYAVKNYKYSQPLHKPSAATNQEQSHDNYNKKQYNNEDSYQQQQSYKGGAIGNNYQPKKLQYVKKQQHPPENNEEQKMSPQSQIPIQNSKQGENKNHMEETKLKNQAPSKSKNLQKQQQNHYQHFDNYQSMFIKSFENKDPSTQGQPDLQQDLQTQYTKEQENSQSQQPQQDQKGNNNNHKQETRADSHQLQEQGVFVNPDAIKQMNKKGNSNKNKHDIRADHHQLLEQGVFVNPEAIKQINKKQKKAQNAKLLAEGSIKPLILEHRSTTPNIATQILEPSIAKITKLKLTTNAKPNVNNPVKPKCKKVKTKQNSQTNGNHIDQLIAFDQQHQSTQHPNYQSQQGFNPYYLQPQMPPSQQQQAFPLLAHPSHLYTLPYNSSQIFNPHNPIASPIISQQPQNQTMPPFYPQQFTQNPQQYNMNLVEQQYQHTNDSMQTSNTCEEHQIQAKQGSQEERTRLTTNPQNNSNDTLQRFINQFAHLNMQLNVPPTQYQNLPPQYSPASFNNNHMQTPVYLAPQIFNQQYMNMSQMPYQQYPYQFQQQLPQAFNQQFIPQVNQLNILTQFLQNQPTFINQQFMSPHPHQDMNYNGAVPYMNNGFMQMNNQQNFYPDPLDNEFYRNLEEEIIQVQILLKHKLKQNEKERNKAFELLKEQISSTYAGNNCCDNLSINLDQSDKVCQDLVSQINIQSKVQVNMYGSMATGLAIDSSDMDILVTGLFQQNDKIQRSQLIQAMSKLYQNLDSFFCINSNSLIDTATIPVIKLKIDLMKIREKYYQCDQDMKRNDDLEMDQQMQYLKIDITFNDQDCDQYKTSAYDTLKNGPGVHLGIKCCQYIKNLIEEYPILEPLILVLKKFLAIKDMNSPFLGGLSSYGLILLIVALLKTGSPQLYDRFDSSSFSLAHTFAYFLQFYGYNFDPQHQIINEDTYIVDAGVNVTGPSACLTIQDPLNPINNIGKSTYNFGCIKMEFARAYDRLMNKLYKFKQQKMMMSLVSNVVEGNEISSNKTKDNPNSSPQGKKIQQLSTPLSILQEVLQIHSITVPKNSVKSVSTINSDDQQEVQQVERDKIR